jgi:hypothetical protein
MADTAKLESLLKELANQGFQFSDIQKALKGAKDAGIIKSKGRGKQPENDPLRMEVRDALLGLKVNGTDLMSKVADATKETVSFMVTLNDNYKVNFIKNMPKDKKEKSDKKEKGPADFEEPAVA